MADSTLDTDANAFKTPSKDDNNPHPPPTTEQARLNLLNKEQLSKQPIEKQPSKLAVGNFSFTIPKKANAPVVVTGALFQKEHRPAAGSDEERHLILAI